MRSQRKSPTNRFVSRWPRRAGSTEPSNRILRVRHRTPVFYGVRGIAKEAFQRLGSSLHPTEGGNTFATPIHPGFFIYCLEAAKHVGQVQPIQTTIATKRANLSTSVFTVGEV